MTKPSHSLLNNASQKQLYDDRYDGNYMDTDAYSTWAHEGLAGYRVRQTLAQVHNHPRRILDYGCGQGKWTPLLRDMYPEAEIVGIDISEVAIAKASNKFSENRFFTFDGSRAALDDSSFDLVFSFHVLEHVLDVAASIKDIARLLRPDGYACIILHSISVDGGRAATGNSHMVLFHGAAYQEFQKTLCMRDDFIPTNAAFAI